MSELHFPWLELSVFVPLLGAVWVGRLRDADLGRQWCLVFCRLHARLDHRRLARLRTARRAAAADDPWHLMTRLLGREPLVVDQLSAPLLPLVGAALFSDGAGHAANQDPPLLVRLDVVLRSHHAGHVQLQRILGASSLCWPWGRCSRFWNCAPAANRPAFTSSTWRCSSC